jgi:hypothetical protein
MIDTYIFSLTSIDLSIYESAKYQTGQHEAAQIVFFSLNVYSIFCKHGEQLERRENGKRETILYCGPTDTKIKRKRS